MNMLKVLVVDDTRLARQELRTLLAGIAAGVADVLGSDHAPHTKDEKARPYPASPSGMPGVQTCRTR